MGKIERFVSKSLSLPIHAYRSIIKPIMPACCRFYPSCSEYALSALETHGPISGSGLIIRRLLRCHPGALGGYDPIKPKQEKR